MIKPFKQFLSESEDESMLSYGSSFREVPEKESVLSWDSSFGEARPKPSETSPKKPTKVNEDAIKKGTSSDWEMTTLMDYEHHLNSNSQGATYNGSIHHHQDYEPQHLTDSHKESIKHYVQTPSEHQEGHQEGHSSSSNMNGYLRNLSGEKKQGIVGGHEPEEVRRSIKKFSFAFTPENTNRKPVTTYGGVPEHIGRKLATSKVGSKHTLAGFTSTSTSKATAKSYGESYKPFKGHGRREGATHVVQYHVEPGAGLSVAPHSKYSENEFTLHHGAHVTYNGSERHRDENGQGIIVHHLTVHNTHKPVDDYRGVYNHPKNLKED
jgi:hypothetical protein